MSRVPGREHPLGRLRTDQLLVDGDLLPIEVGDSCFNRGAVKGCAASVELHLSALGVAGRRGITAINVSPASLEDLFLRQYDTEPTAGARP